MMTTAKQLMNEGVGFTILDEDAVFGEDGELSHCRTIVDTMYEAFDGDGEAETFIGEGIEDGKLSDDDGACASEYIYIWDELWVKSPIAKARCAGSKRWDHIRDAHFAEELHTAKLLSMTDRLWKKADAAVDFAHLLGLVTGDEPEVPADEKITDWGELKYYGVERWRRFRMMIRFIEKLPQERLRNSRSKLWARHKARVASCVAMGVPQLILFTKAQISYLMELYTVREARYALAKALKPLTTI